jgi:multidrug efflux pump subunit AcrA (membrane-fusion protein)
MKIKRKKILIGLVIILPVSVAILLSFQKLTSETTLPLAEVKKGPFIISVESSGELEAKNSVKVFGPKNMRSAHVWNIKIADIVPEGTEVKKGDYVAQLDRTEVAEAQKNALLDLENRELELNQARIDTAIELQQARNNLENLLSAMKERKLELEKSVYEPPVTIKQAEVNLEKAKRNYKQAKDEYELKLEKAQSKIRSANIKVQKIKQRVDLLDEVLNQLTVTAPESGMVIYTRDHRGNKLNAGSMISSWDPVVAELPDLSILISRTYINEVDIRKIQKGQMVNITFDAFPEKQMKGKVISVANVGETISGNDSKVFPVTIEIKGSDKDLKPGMTTGNSIVTKKADSVLYAPIETVYSQGDSLYYVYKKEGFSAIKQEVETNLRNNMDIQIAKGLKEGDKVLFLPPKDSETMDINYLN